MNRVRTSLALAAALCVLALAGCASAVFQQPTVTLEGVRIGGIGLRGGTLLVDVRVVNPNRFELSANALAYRLAVADPAAAGDTAWIDFAAGSYDQPFVVAGRDSASVQIPVDFSYGGLGGAASSLLGRGSFTYRAEGTVDVRTPLGTYEVPFRRRGTVALMGDR